jgi:hypothetical protein
MSPEIRGDPSHASVLGERSDLGLLDLVVVRLLTEVMEDRGE